MSAKRYPGRDRVISRESARDYLWRQSLEFQSKPLACSNPVPLHAIGLPSFYEADKSKLPVEMQLRCRKCPECLAHRRRLWTARAIAETSASGRTWFGTLTVAPMERFKLGVRAEQKVLRCGGESLSSLEPAERLTILANALAPEVTRWLKRVRAETRAPLRYLLVTEAHKDGFPHLHILLHEKDTHVPKRTLESQWRLGFSHWRLVDTGDARSAYYACKYLSKDAQTRVRASIRYGQPHLVRIITERAVKARDTLEVLLNEREERDKANDDGDNGFSMTSTTIVGDTNTTKEKKK